MARRSASDASPPSRPAGGTAPAGSAGPPDTARFPAKTRRTAEAVESAENRQPVKTAWLPRLMFLFFLALLLTVTGMEVQNALRHPSVKRAIPPAGSAAGTPALTFYQKGYAPARVAWLFDEPEGSAGPPRLIQRIDCRPQPATIGEIRWTADGKAVYATSRTPPSRHQPAIRWLFEFASPPAATPSGRAATPPVPAPAGAAPGRLYLASPDDALPQRTVFVESAAALASRWQRHGGAGPAAAAWYELGSQGPHLFSWQITRWERLLPE